MFPTRALFSNTVRVTLFTRANCGLCVTAKNTVAQLNKRKPFDYHEVDIMVPGNEAWKNVYEFDVPVLHIQAPRTGGTELSDPKKLFHRFTEEAVEDLVDQVEKEAH